MFAHAHTHNELRCGVALDRLKILRAFASAFIDPELKAEAEKHSYEVGPVAGKEMKKLAKEVMQPPQCSNE